MGRRGGRRKGSQGRAQERVRGRARGAKRGGGGSANRRRGGINLGDVGVGALGGYAGRLADRPGGVSGLTGAAAGLAGGGLAGRFLRGGEGSDEDLSGEFADRFALVEERLQLLEDQVRELRELLGSAEDPAEAEGGTDPGSGA